LRHLFLARELTAYRLNTLHNLTFYLGLMAEMRAAIAAGTFQRLRRRILDAYGSAPAQPVPVPAQAPGQGGGALSASPTPCAPPRRVAARGALHSSSSRWY